MKNIYLISALLVTLAACNRVTTTEVRLTSEAGDKYALQDDITFRKGKAPMALVTVNPADERQTIDGFGASITESSAFVLACLVPEQRKMVLHELFGEEGANFSATRTVIGSSDFTLKGHYSYDDIPGDDSLKYFSLAVHQDGWDKSVYPQIKDESFDMYQFIRAMNLERPAFYGFSDGGIIGLLLITSHPGSIGALAISGTNLSPEGMIPSFVEVKPHFS